MYNTNNNGGSWMCPRISSDLCDYIYYGGSTQWFKRNTAFKCSSGAVAGANIVTSLALKDPFYGKRFKIYLDEDNMIDQNNFTLMMYKLYIRMGIFELPILNFIYDKSDRNKKFILPVSTGLSLYHFIRGILHLAAKHNVALQYDSIYTHKCSYIRGLTFIKLGISYGFPIAVLTKRNALSYTLYHEPYGQAPSTEIMRNQFFTITDIQETTTHNCPDLILSIDGKMGRISYQTLYDSWQSHQAYKTGMVYFAPGHFFHPYSWVFPECKWLFKSKK